MITKNVIEGLLYKSKNIKYMKTCLELAHVLNDNDRDWQPIEHSEFHFVDLFTDPYYLIIIDKQIHVYLIGEKAKGKSFNVLNIEGNSTEHWTLSKSAITQNITNTLKESQSLFLPSPLTQRIIFINKQKHEFDNINDLVLFDDIFIFNRQTKDDVTLKKSKWTFGIDIYSVNQQEYTTSVSDILKECFKEIEEFNEEEGE